MKLTKTIKFIYGKEEKIIRARIFYVYEPIIKAIGKPNYFLSKSIIMNKKKDTIGGPHIYQAICNMNQYYRLGHFLDTWKEVLLQAELDFVTDLFISSQLDNTEQIKIDVETIE